MTTKTPLTRSQLVAADVVALLRARNPLLWIVTREEARVERHLVEAAAAAAYEPFTWDVGQGVARIDGTPVNNVGSTDPGETLDAIGERAKAGGERTVWIMRDLPVWIEGPVGATALRKLRNLARMLPGVPRDDAQAVIVLTPSADIPPELTGHATVIEWPLPDRAEIAAILDAAVAALPETDSKGEPLRAKAAPNGTRDAAIDAAVGLSGEEAQACYAKSLVQLRKIDPVVVGKEKKRVIARERVLEWHDPLPGGLEAVGGLDNLKAWLVSRAAAYSKKARDYGLPAPKGAMVVGISGTGKSLTAKAVATAWGVPLLRLDLGALQDKYVGESQKAVRKAFGVIEALGRCVVWIDEVEKAMAGATQGAADGGVSADQLGVFLNWMQERQGEAFVIATANDVTSLPPEFLRKGRFDEVWWVDLPTERERAAIAAAALRAHGRKTLADDSDLPEEIALITDGFTGAEIAALVPDALFTAFADGEREITLADLKEAVRTTVPLIKTAPEKITAMRNWAKGKARPASKEERATATVKTVRSLDL